jgi:quinol monooxygenase YgiN
MAKIIIAAQIDIDPARREEALRTARPHIVAALAEEGCIRYDWSACAMNPARINVFEEWESEEALAAHFRNPAYTGMRDHIGTFGITAAASRKYRVAAEAPVYNARGQASADFD